ncbi:hypothetical protein KJ682_00940 [bacterium]|nr:hypothetical protein [bacterium]
MGAGILHLRPGRVGPQGHPRPGPSDDERRRFGTFCAGLTPVWSFVPDGLLLDLTGTGRIHGPGFAGAERVGRLAHDLLGIPAAGFASSCLAARLASRLAAVLGGGMLGVPAQSQDTFLAGVSLAAIPVDRRSLDRLRELGVHTLGDLQVVPRDLLKAVFGTAGLELAALASGGGMATDLQPGGPDGGSGPGRLVIGARLARPLDDDLVLRALLQGLALRALAWERDRTGPTTRWDLVAGYSGGEAGQARSLGPASDGYRAWRMLVGDLWRKLGNRRRGLLSLDLHVRHGAGGAGARQGTLFGEDRDDVRLAEVIDRVGTDWPGSLAPASEGLLKAWGVRWVPGKAQGKPGRGLVDGRAAGG